MRSKRPSIVITSCVKLFIVSTTTVLPVFITTLSAAAVGELLGVKLSGLFGKAPDGSKVHISQSPQFPEISVYHVLPATPSSGLFSASSVPNV